HGILRSVIHLVLFHGGCGGGCSRRLVALAVLCVDDSNCSKRDDGHRGEGEHERLSRALPLRARKSLRGWGGASTLDVRTVVGELLEHAVELARKRLGFLLCARAENERIEIIGVSLLHSRMLRLTRGGWRARIVCCVKLTSFSVKLLRVNSVLVAFRLMGTGHRCSFSRMPSEYRGLTKTAVWQHYATPQSSVNDQAKSSSSQRSS